MNASYPDGFIEASTAWHWHLYHSAGDARRGDHAQGAIRELLLELVGAVEKEKSSSRSSHWALGYPRGYRRGGISQSKHILRGDERTLEILQQIYENICHLMAKAYDDGLRRGKSFITDIALGNIKVRDLENL